MPCSFYGEGIGLSGSAILLLLFKKLPVAGLVSEKGLDQLRPALLTTAGVDERDAETDEEIRARTSLMIVMAQFFATRLLLVNSWFILLLPVLIIGLADSLTNKL